MNSVEEVEMNLSFYSTNENLSINDDSVIIEDHSNEIQDVEETIVDSDNSEKYSTNAKKNSIETTKIPRLSSSRNFTNDTVHIYSPKRYQFRKSHSLMDIQRFQNVRTPRRIIAAANKVSVATMQSETGDSIEQSYQISEDFCCFVGGDHASSEEFIPTDPKLAGMRIFASIMLNSWRRRREEVRHLNEEINRYKKSAIKAKTQIHVLNSIFKVEQKQNDDLNCRLRRCQAEQQRIQDLYDDLNLSFIDLRNRNADIEQEIEMKSTELKDLKETIVSSEKKFQKTLSHIKKLEDLLTTDEKRIFELENEKNNLLNKLEFTKDANENREIDFKELISKKDAEIDKLKNQLDVLDKKLTDLKIKETQVKEYEILDLSQRKLIQDLNEELAKLQKEIDSSFKNRLREFVRTVPGGTLQYLNFISLLLLPPVPSPPAPKLPSTKGLEKVLEFVWR